MKIDYLISNASPGQNSIVESLLEIWGATTLVLEVCLLHITPFSGQDELALTEYGVWT
jgi:hypothetical protein